MKKEKKNASTETDKKKDDVHNAPVKENEKFPGYPLYPESDDIMSAHNHATKIQLEDINDSGEEITKIEEPDSAKKPHKKSGSLSGKSSSNEADITKEDLELLGSDELNNDGGEDDDLKNRTHPVDMSAGDLDIPGTELDDPDENIGEEDEENNSYSIGGDRHEDLDENTGKD